MAASVRLKGSSVSARHCGTWPSAQSTWRRLRKSGGNFGGKLVPRAFSQGYVHLSAPKPKPAKPSSPKARKGSEGSHRRALPVRAKTAKQQRVRRVNCHRKHRHLQELCVRLVEALYGENVTTSQ